MAPGAPPAAVPRDDCARSRALLNAVPLVATLIDSSATRVLLQVRLLACCFYSYSRNRFTVQLCGGPSRPSPWHFHLLEKL